MLVATRPRALDPRLGMRQEETVSHVAGGVREASATIAEHGSRTAGQAADAVASAYDAATNAASRAADTASLPRPALPMRCRKQARSGVARFSKVLAEGFEGQPLLLGVVGIAIGAGIAASIPTTEAENKVMGGASDFVREAVSEKAAQVKEMADAAVHEAKAQGLTSAAAGEALRAIGDKVGAFGRRRQPRKVPREPPQIGWYVGSSAVASTYGAAAGLIVLLWVYWGNQTSCSAPNWLERYASLHGSRPEPKAGKAASACNGVMHAAPRSPRRPWLRTAGRPRRPGGRLQTAIRRAFVASLGQRLSTVRRAPPRSARVLRGRRRRIHSRLNGCPRSSARPVPRGVFAAVVRPSCSPRRHLRQRLAAQAITSGLARTARPTRPPIAEAWPFHSPTVAAMLFERLEQLLEQYLG